MNTPSRKTVRLIVILAAVAAVLIGGVVWISKTSSVTTKGNELQSSMSAVYNNGASTLSKCLTTTRQTANVAGENAKAFDQVIRDAVAGQGKSANVDYRQPGAGNSLLPILVQAYPDLKGQTDLFDKVIITIAGCQEDFRGAQSVVQEKVREFDSWRLNYWNDFFGSDAFPNNNLVVTIPGVNPIYGKAALDKIKQPIVTADTSGAYQNGTYTPENPFPATPAPTAGR